MNPAVPNAIVQTKCKPRRMVPTTCADPLKCVECSAGKPATNLTCGGAKGNNNYKPNADTTSGTGTDSIRICQNDKRYRGTEPINRKQQLIGGWETSLLCGAVSYGTKQTITEKGK